MRFAGAGRAFMYTGRIVFKEGMIGYYDPVTKEHKILYTSTGNDDIAIYNYSAYAVSPIH